MKSIRLDSDLILSGGYHEFEIDSDRPLTLTFSAQENCEIFVRIKRAEILRIHTFTPAGVKAAYLFWNELKNDLSVEEVHTVMADGDCHVAYCEVNPAATDRKVRMDLREEGANGRLSSACFVTVRKAFDVQVANYAPHTIGQMDHYSVVLKGGSYEMNATGKIVKGAHNSENHQVSRSLTFDDDQISRIIPTLLIDENEVQASHAMSVGRIDEDQLYYMMSRGLDLQACTRLISTGYLLPIARIITDPELQKQLQEELEEKIGTIC